MAEKAVANGGETSEEINSTDLQLNHQEIPKDDSYLPPDSKKIYSPDEQAKGQKRPNDGSENSALPEELRKMFKPLACELCNVVVLTTTSAYAHYEGKNHIKSVNAYMNKHYNVQNHFKKKKIDFEPVKCEVCNIELSSSVVYKQHLAGKKHQKNIKKNYVEPPKITAQVDPTGRFNIGKAFYVDTQQQEQPQAQPQSQPPKSQFYCDICQVFTDTAAQMTVHKEGQKHAKRVAKRNSMNQNVSTEPVVNKSEEYYNEDNVWEASPKKTNSS